MIVYHVRYRLPMYMHTQTCSVGFDIASNHTMNHITELSFPDVGLTGTLGMIGRLLHLSVLGLSHNHITGSIPPGVYISCSHSVK